MREKCLLKRGLMLLAAVLLTVCAIWEYAMPTDAAVKSYYVKVEDAGKPVQKSIQRVQICIKCL